MRIHFTCRIILGLSILLSTMGCEYPIHLQDYPRTEYRKVQVPHPRLALNAGEYTVSILRNEYNLRHEFTCRPQSGMSTTECRGMVTLLSIIVGEYNLSTEYSMSTEFTCRMLSGSRHMPTGEGRKEGCADGESTVRTYTEHSRQISSAGGRNVLSPQPASIIKVSMC